MDNLALHGGFARGAMGRVRWSEQEQETPRARALRRRPRHPPPARRRDAGRADGRRDRRGAAGLAGRQRRARARRADGGPAARRGRAALRDGPRGPERGHERALRLAPSRRDLRAGRPRDRPARRPRDRHPLGRRHRRGGTREPDGRRGRRPGLPRAGGGAPRRAGRPRGARRPRALAARRRPRRPPRRDPRHRRPRGRGRARAAVRDRRLRAARRQRPHPPAGAVREWSDAADAQDLDIPLVPADRGREGIVAEFAVSENLSLSVLGRLGRRGRLDKRAEAELVERWTQRLGVVTAGPGRRSRR